MRDPAPTTRSGARSLTRASDDDLDAWRGTPDPLEFGYTNWRGERGNRRVQPTRLYYGSTEWHPEPQWLLEAIDLDKGEVRAFAVKDIGSASPAASTEALTKERDRWIADWQAANAECRRLEEDAGATEAALSASLERERAMREALTGLADVMEGDCDVEPCVGSMAPAEHYLGLARTALQPQEATDGR